MKKYGGVLHSWRKHHLGSKYSQEYLDQTYGPNLGFIVTGTLHHDPTGRFGKGPIQTSLVVKFSETQIETLNTIYDLGEPFDQS